MYESYYGFKEKPFNLTPDPDYFFMSRGHEEAYTHLEYAITENKGFVVITGEIGSGKTTLINYFLRKLRQDIQVAVINQTLLQPKQFLKMICREFELSVNGMDKSETLDLFQNFLVKQFAKRIRIALIIDESQNLPDKTIEEIRLLSNLESEKQHLIQILLLGQPELKNKLQKKNMEQFIQRVTVYWHLNSLDNDEVNQYIHHRLRVAGSERFDIFDQEAIDAIYKHSRGIPRLINILCDAALVHGYADELKTIDNKVIDEVLKVRDIGGAITESTESDKKAKTPFIKEKYFEQLDHRIKAMEKKIYLLENTMANLNQSLDIFSSTKIKRDELILELTKMLKRSMESQTNLILNMIELKQREKENNIIKHSITKDSPVTPISNPLPNKAENDSEN